MKAAAPTSSQRLQRFMRGKQTFATYTIIGITVAAYAIVTLHDRSSTNPEQWFRDLALYGPYVHRGDWWRLFTVALVHENLIHIGFNMLLLGIVGLLLEPGAGPLRVTTLYVVSVLAGSAGALLVQPHTPSVGASGGVFGVSAAAALVMYRRGTSFWDTGFGPLIVINLVYDYFTPNISIAAHIGGLIGGLLATEAMLQARKVKQPWLGYVGAIAVGAASFVIALAAAGR